MRFSTSMTIHNALVVRVPEHGDDIMSFIINLVCELMHCTGFALA